MKLTTTTTHEITFSVCYFEDTEGGMNSDSFGKSVNELAEAIELLGIAKAQDPSKNWVIVADVETKISAKHGGV